MQRLRQAVGPATLLLVLLPVACGFGDPAGEGALPEVPGMFALSTTSGAVQADVVRAEYAMDVLRRRDAWQNAQDAIALDPSYAYAHLLAFQSGPTVDESSPHLQHAIANLATANATERKMIEAAKAAFDGNPEGALAFEQELVDAEPTNPRFRMAVAQRLAGLARVDEARASAARAIELDPQYVGAMLWLGGNLTTDQPTDFARAEQVLGTAVQLAPAEPFAHDLLADVHRQQGRYQEAIEGYTRAMEIEPRMAAFVGQRGHVYVFMGNYDAARRDYEAAAAASAAAGDADQVWWIGQVAYSYLQAGDVDQALRVLERARSMAAADETPVGVDARINTLWDIAFVAGHNGRVDEARRAYDELRPLALARAERTGSDQVVRAVRRNMLDLDGALAIWQGDFATARARAREAMQVVRDLPSPRRNEISHSILGLADLGERRYEDALAHFREGGENDLYNEFHMAQALEHLGRTDEAIDHYRHIADMRFSNVIVALLRSSARARLEALRPA